MSLLGKPINPLLFREFHKNSVGFSLFLRDEWGRSTHMARPVEMQPIAETNQPYQGSAFSLYAEQCQELTEQLSQLGFKPSESGGTVATREGHELTIKALQAEIEWLRSIVHEVITSSRRKNPDDIPF